MTARRAMYAVYAVFILNGFAFASWASRIPQVRDGLELNPRSSASCCWRSRSAR